MYSLLFQRQQHDGKGSFLYWLYGAVIHDGRSLESGHYTACVRMRTVHLSTATTFLQKTFLDREKMMNKDELIELVANDLPREHVEEPPTRHDHDDSQDYWFDISDSSVSKVDFDKVLKKEAYLLFYERIA